MPDEMRVHECGTCGVLHRAKEIGVAEGAEAEVAFRVPYCVTCCHNPHRIDAMSVVDSMQLGDTAKGIVTKLLPPNEDHWIPIETD